MPDEITTDKEEIVKPKTVGKIPSVFRNFTSLIGMTIVGASLAGILFLFLAEIAGSREKPYLGIFTYIVFPFFMFIGIAVMAVGALIERRRRRHMSPSEFSAYPTIDLNDPKRRRQVLTFLGVVLLFLFVSAFGSYRAYEYTDSVTFCGQLCHAPMNPEFVAYQGSPHARVRCVECHVGPGATGYVRSKISGIHQLSGVVFNNYSKPIPTPVDNLRPAQETCEHCHWPEKDYGKELKVFNRYGYDEHNTLYQARMLVKVGGGNPTAGAASGIHWHMNLANEITYGWSGDHRQVVPWVRLKSADGKVEEYMLSDAKLSSQQIAALPKKQMDCIDCHNRPTHIFRPPDDSVNDAFDAGKLDVSLPYLKRQAVEALSKEYGSTSQAISAIAANLNEFYRTNYPDIYAGKRESLQSAIAEIQRLYQTNFFPEMKVDWQSHPDNVGHYYVQGCFRCHDGKHVSTSDPNKIIRNDCNICHEMLDQKEGNATATSKNGLFVHPGFFGNITKYNCSDCHTGKGVTVANFQHPAGINIEGQKCADCHLRSHAEK